MRVATLGQESIDVDRAIEIQCGVPSGAVPSELDNVPEVITDGETAQDVADTEPETEPVKNKTAVVAVVLSLLTL